MSLVSTDDRVAIRKGTLVIDPAKITSVFGKEICAVRVEWFMEHASKQRRR
jgi:hypothetical protein